VSMAANSSGISSVTCMVHPIITGNDRLAASPNRDSKGFRRPAIRTLTSFAAAWLPPQTPCAGALLRRVILTKYEGFAECARTFNVLPHRESS
jgi:hypothetical protein